jgi:hypothetical protein
MQKRQRSAGVLTFKLQAPNGAGVSLQSDSAILRTRAICLALTRPLSGTALAIARALPNTPSQSRRDNPGLAAAFVPEKEGTETVEEVIIAVLIVFPFRQKHFDVTNIGFRAATFQLWIVLPVIMKMNKSAERLK